MPPAHSERSPADARSAATNPDGALGRLLVSLTLGRGGDLERAAGVAIARRLAGLFLDGAGAMGARPRLAAATIDALRAAARHEAADDVRVERETDAVLALLSPLRPVVLKGRALALEVWPRPALRPAGDLDILLEPRAVEDAAAELCAHGYRRAPRLPDLPLRRADTGIELLAPPGRALAVDLHARLFRSVGHRVDAARLLARSRPGRIGAHAVRRLDDADRLLYLAIHAAKHGAAELKWLLDLYAVALRTDEPTWYRVARRARATGTERPVWAAASLVAALAGAAPALATLRPWPPWPWLLGALISRDRAVAGSAPTRLERYALELCLEPGIAARARMVFGLLARRALRPRAG